jgi:hypothetical protein
MSTQRLPGGALPRPADEELDEGGEERVREVFAAYRSSVRWPGTQAHPGDVAEASSLRWAAVGRPASRRALRPLRAAAPRPRPPAACGRPQQRAHSTPPLAAVPAPRAAGPPPPPPARAPRSAIPLPPTDYPLADALPPDVLASGKLSQLQVRRGGARVPPARMPAAAAACSLAPAPGRPLSARAPTPIPARPAPPEHPPPPPPGSWRASCTPARGTRKSCRRASARASSSATARASARGGRSRAASSTTMPAAGGGSWGVLGQPPAGGGRAQQRRRLWSMDPRRPGPPLARPRRASLRSRCARRRPPPPLPQARRLAEHQQRPVPGRHARPAGPGWV